MNVSSTPKTCLRLKGLADHLIVAVLEGADQTRGGIKVANFRMYRRDEHHAASGLEMKADLEEWDQRKIDEAEKDLEEGYWDYKEIEVRPIVNAVVIGENPALEYMAAPPRFGDIVTICQKTSAQYLGLHKLGADTTPTNEILVQNFAGDRDHAVSLNAVLLAVRLKDVFGIHLRHEEIEELRKRASNEHTTGRPEGRTA